ncbi:MAG: sigma 54-interacting transcriptional regulator, partial [Deltaproteobacteria bacterium]|nr:sigma 54-interacting transcriptional regulator [Deltaproteobacteria bacterium]
MSGLVKNNDVLAENESILIVAAFFDGDFSIDWIQELTQIKASRILKFFEQCCLDCIIEKRDVDRFLFSDIKQKHKLLKSISSQNKEDLHRKIADLFAKEYLDEPNFKTVIAEYQFLFQNSISECRRLKEIGDYFRKHGPPGKSLQCYDKIIHDLEFIDSLEADTLLIETTISYSKDLSIINDTSQAIFYLKNALKLAKKRKNLTQQALVLFHLASNEGLQRNFELAYDHFNKGVSLAKGVEIPELNRSKLTISMLILFWQGRYKDAISTYETHEPVFSQQFPKHRISKGAAVFLGFSYYFLGQISQARGNLDALRNYSQKTGDNYNYISASLTLGFEFVLMHNFEEAEKRLTPIFKTSKKNHTLARCTTAFQLAYCSFKTQQITKSKQYLVEALTISKSKNYNLLYFHFMLEFADAMDRGEYPRVFDITLEDQIKQAMESKNITMQGIAFRYKAIKSKGTECPEDEIFKYLCQSLELLEESGSQQQIAMTQLELGSHYLRVGNIIQAKKNVTAAARILYPLNQDLVPAELKDLIDFVVVKNRLLEKILNLGQKMMSGRSSQEIVQTIFSEINQITGAERAAIFLKNKGSKPLDFQLWATRNLTQEDIRLSEFAKSMEAVQESTRSGEIQILTTECGKSEKKARTSPIKSIICIPMVSKGEVIGSLYHDNRLMKSTFKKQDQDMLFYLASFAAIALDNARAYEEIQRLNDKLKEEKQYYEVQHLESLNFSDCIVASDAMKEVLAMAEKVAKSESTVLIMGETGVGKEVIARAVHRLSPRSKKSFISLNCAALPENLVSSELFGHEKGAFTGAINRHVGRFELANGGTLFLDEIGEISNDLQVRLLRVLETKEYERVGGKETLNSDFRLLVATNRNLEEDVQNGRFRSDLYYRLNVFPILVPPLRERRGDILPLANYFLNIYANKSGKSFKGIGKEETRYLLAHDWPGNVRELENMIERGVILNTENVFKIHEC